MSLFDISFTDCEKNVNNVWKNIELLDKYHSQFKTFDYINILIMLWYSLNPNKTTF